MSDREERAYEEGRRSAIRSLLIQLTADLYPEDSSRLSSTVRLSRLVQERDETRAKLRELCESLGCDDWPDDLYLPDVIDKYLEPGIEAELDRVQQLHR